MNQIRITVTKEAIDFLLRHGIFTSIRGDTEITIDLEQRIEYKEPEQRYTFNGVPLVNQPGKEAW